MQRIATIFGTIAAIATVGALLISVWEINNTLKNEEIHKWQKTIVFSIISENQTEAGISFKEIQADYLASVQQFMEFKIPSEEIQELALKRVLLELLSDGVIVMDEKERFAPEIRTLYTEGKKTFNRIKTEEGKNAILIAVEQASCKFKSEEIRAKIHDKIALTPEELADILTRLIAAKRISINSDGYLCSILHGN